MSTFKCRRVLALPPMYFWMRGAWEIMIKLAKCALKTATNDRTVHKEVLEMFRTVVERTLNSRSLTLSE